VALLVVDPHCKPKGLGLIGILNLVNPSGRTGSTQPLTKISMKDILWGVKGGRGVELNTLLLSCANSLEIMGASTSRIPKGISGL